MASVFARRSPAPAPPRVWGMLMDYWQVPASLAMTWWRALGRSHHARALAQDWRRHTSDGGTIGRYAVWGWPPARPNLAGYVSDGSYCEKRLDQHECAGLDHGVGHPISFWSSLWLVAVD